MDDFRKKGKKIWPKSTGFCPFPKGTRLHVTNVLGRVMVGPLKEVRGCLGYLGDGGAENAFAEDAIVRRARDDEPDENISMPVPYPTGCKNRFWEQRKIEERKRDAEMNKSFTDEQKKAAVDRVRQGNRSQSRKQRLKQMLFLRGC